MPCWVFAKSSQPRRSSLIADKRVESVYNSQRSVLHRELSNSLVAHIFEYLDPRSLMTMRQVCFLFQEIMDNDEFELWVKLRVRLYPSEATGKTFNAVDERRALDTYKAQLSATSTPRRSESRMLSDNQRAKIDYMNLIEHWFDSSAVKKKYKETRYYVSGRLPGLILPDKYHRFEGCDRPLFSSKFIFNGKVYKGDLACVNAAEIILPEMGWQASLSFEEKSTLAKLYVQEVLFPFAKFQHFITMVVCSEDERKMFVTLTIFFETSERCDVTCIFDMRSGKCEIKNVVSQFA